jgi:hypothetical protein
LCVPEQCQPAEADRLCHYEPLQTPKHCPVWGIDVHHCGGGLEINAEAILRCEDGRLGMFFVRIIRVRQSSHSRRSRYGYDQTEWTFRVEWSMLSLRRLGLVVVKRGKGRRGPDAVSCVAEKSVSTRPHSDMCMNESAAVRTGQKRGPRWGRPAGESCHMECR